MPRPSEWLSLKDKMKNPKKQKIIIAMSGGVDSSVAAALLKKEGKADVVGVFMKFWTEPKTGEVSRDWNRCCSPEAEKRARMVAKMLGIPFYVFNFEKEFKKRIVDEFLKGYKEGITPNPCVICNKEIKFGLLLEKVLALNADFVATGHYAKLRQGKLYRGNDKKKDQSYFLWQLTQAKLKRILFPVGGYTKPEVRKLAEKFKLPFKKVPESMEICFVPDKLDDFLKRHLKPKPGLIMTAEGKEIGKHQGLPFYTIGQRKGIELSGGPFYVVGKNIKKNNLIVASILKDSALWSKSLAAKNVNWISGKAPKLPLKINAQIRYGHQAVPATITKIPNTKYQIQFRQPQRAVTPGQSVVFYKGQELLGGGIIC
ncbi:MAG: tRNA 2-thiouridine(34) synthase MnmA [bacterium]|nr:tRNA 2-thiouridine(34) synthase MnmA [bacterium]